MSGEVAGYDVVVLAGGSGRRLGGVDKPGLSVGGTALLDRVLEACRGADRTVVVGPRRGTVRPVEWVREEPAGGGPLAALAAGARRTAAGLVLVLAADLPFVTARTVAWLLGELPAGADGVLAVDAGGRDQPLLAVYRAEPLRRGLALIAAEHGTLGGLPLRLLTGDLALARTGGDDGSGGEATFDTDTWGALATARARIREHGRVLDEWIAAVKADLGIELDVDTAALLDLARDAAHSVARPAAPLTTFLVGYAAGAAGGGPEAVAEAVRKATDLARRWEAETASADAPAPERSEGPGTSEGRGTAEGRGSSEGGGPTR
jgi:molybdopterin-guanine dinucleotide biosynthesis protein A